MKTILLFMVLLTSALAHEGSHTHYFSTLHAESFFLLLLSGVLLFVSYKYFTKERL